MGHPEAQDSPCQPSASHVQGPFQSQALRSNS